MAEELLDTVRDAVEAPIDFKGQRDAEQVTTISLMIVGAIAFLAGYLTQNIAYTLWTGLAGTVLAFVAVVPPWPVYNKNPVTWLPSQKEIAGLQISFDKR